MKMRNTSTMVKKTTMIEEELKKQMMKMNE